MVPQIGGPLRVQLTRSMGSRLKTMIGGSLSLSRALSLSLSLALLFAILVPMVSRCLEAWRRLRAEYDPTPSMRRVAILGRLGLVQNPPHCKSVGELGGALEQWLSLKRQHEVFTDRDGNPIKSSV